MCGNTETVELIHYHVRETDQSSRLIDLLCERFGRKSNDEWRSQIQRGRLTVDGQLAQPETPIEVGSVVGFDPTDQEEPPTDTRWWTLYEDELVWVIHKPAPLPCHRNGPYLRSNLMALLRLATNGQRMHLMARLDRDTSGAVLVAKTRATCQAIHKAGNTTKVYWCVVSGETPEHFQCAEPMGPEPGHPTRQHCGSGKSALTFFRRLDTHNGNSLLEARPQTGRTHQIRCHLGHLGWPILGDRLYGDSIQADNHRPKRQLLHAVQITFQHPQRGAMTTIAPLPEDFVAACGQRKLQLPDVDSHSKASDCSNINLAQETE